jgi:TPR repeat protein
MQKAKSAPRHQTRKTRAEELFKRADEQWEAGNLRSAFRLLLAAAKMGSSSARLNLGYMYNTGAGVRRSREAALHWYRRAYRQDNPCADSNIGTIFRDEGDFDRALRWFQRAIRLNGGDDGDADLEIAQLYLKHSRDIPKAVHHLKNACRSKNVTQHGLEQAKRLLERTKRRLNR